MSRILVSVACAALGFTACGAIDAASVESTTDEVESTESAVGTSLPVIVTLRRDMRKCVSPLCGGYYAKNANTGRSEQYVNGLDFSQSGFSAEEQDQVLGAQDGELLIYGRLGKAEPKFKTRALIVLGAWRGLPGVKLGAPSSKYYTIEPSGLRCFAAPCPGIKANLVNQRKNVLIDDLDITKAVLPNVDATWLSTRLWDKSAIAFAEVVPGTVYPNGTAKTLAVSQIFIQIPEPKCPMYSLMPCPSRSQVHTWSRNEQGCLVPTGCQVPDPNCPTLRPWCAAGYSVQSWTGGPGACSTNFVCEPEFAQH